MCASVLCVCLHFLPLVSVPHFSSFHHGYSTLTQIFSTSLWSLTFNVFFHWLRIMWVMEEVKLILLLHSLQVTEDECQTKCPQCNTETGLTLAGSFYCSLSDVHQLKKAFQKHPEYSAVTDTNWIKQKIKKKMSHSLSSYSWVMGAIIYLMSGCQDVLKMTSKNSCTYSLSVVTVVTNFTILYVAHAVWESSSKLPVLSTSQMSKCHDLHQIYPVVSFKVKVLKLSFKLWSLAAFSSLTSPPSPPTQYKSQAVNS